MKSNKGFSLVELIVVIAIMAIIAGVAVPVYSGYITKANEAKAQSVTDEVAHAEKIAQAEYGTSLKVTYAIGANNLVTFTVSGATDTNDNAKAAKDIATVVGGTYTSEDSFTVTIEHVTAAIMTESGLTATSNG